jgi:hypothetical protein
LNHLGLAGIRGWYGPRQVPISELVERLERGHLQRAAEASEAGRGRGCHREGHEPGRGRGRGCRSRKGHCGPEGQLCTCRRRGLPSCNCS